MSGQYQVGAIQHAVVGSCNSFFHFWMVTILVKGDIIVCTSL